MERLEKKFPGYERLVLVGEPRSYFKWQDELEPFVKAIAKSMGPKIWVEVGLEGLML